MNSREIRSLVKALRSALGVRQVDFAKSIGVSASTAALWEAEKRFAAPQSKHYAAMAALAASRGLSEQAATLQRLAHAALPDAVRSLTGSVPASGVSPLDAKVDTADSAVPSGDNIDSVLNKASAENEIWILAFRNILESGHKRAIAAIKQNVEAFDELVRRTRSGFDESVSAFDRAEAEFRKLARDAEHRRKNEAGSKARGKDAGGRRKAG